MRVSTDARRQFKPYKGPESYQVEDAALFFGRKAAAEQIVAHVLSSRMTLLHAQSGAGKTSLVNALVTPQLEERGWMPVRILLQNDPVRATRLTCLQHVLPPPEAEIHALARLLEALAADEDDPTLGELLRMYDDNRTLPVRDPRKRLLISPVELSELGERRSALGEGRVMPYICRVLRSSLDLTGLASHFAALATACGTCEQPWEPVTEHTRARALIDLLGTPAFRANYAATLDYLDLPVRELRPFLDNLFRVYGAARPGFCLVLIFDQFEELFTRFVDPGSLVTTSQADMPDWRLRLEFFDELHALYRSAPEGEGMLPVRYLLSMRSEYIAQLRPIREFAPEIDRSTYQLELLSWDDAKQAIEEPAVLYGYTYEPECFTQILDDLLKEERYIEPAHLSLVCEKLWFEAGRELAREAPLAEDRSQLPSVALATYAERLAGAKGILRAFLRDFLRELPDDDARREALELLEPLITGSGTRNIVEQRQLVEVPLRDAARRKALLDKLVNRTLVRVETRLGGHFAEITHEFLIRAVQEALQEFLYSHAEYQRFRVALRALAESRRNHAASTAAELDKGDFQSLDRNRLRVSWNDWATEQMLRACLQHADPRPGLRDTIGHWIGAAAQFAQALDADTLRQRIDEASPLSGRELSWLNAHRDALGLTREQRAKVMRCHLMRAASEGDDDIRYWTLQVMR